MKLFKGGGILSHFSIGFPEAFHVHLKVGQSDFFRSTQQNRCKESVIDGNMLMLQSSCMDEITFLWELY